MEDIDSLPRGVGWQCEDITVEGDLPDLGKDSSGKINRQESLELWYRDPLDCVRELLENPAFRDVMRYAPEKLYADEEGEIEVIDEMWTGAWWWELQVSQNFVLEEVPTHHSPLRNAFLMVLLSYLL